MSIANCSRCGKMYQKLAGTKLCQDCMQAEEDAFRLVRTYLEENPGCDMPAVSDGTGVEEPMILRLVQQGRLGTLGELVMGLRVECRQCTKPVISGRYCPECTETMGQALKESAKSLLEKPNDGHMRHRRPETLHEKRYPGS